MANKPRTVRLVLSVLQTSAGGFGLGSGGEFSLFDDRFADGEDFDASASDLTDGPGYELPYDFEDAILRRMEEEESPSSSDGMYELTTTAEYTEEDGRVTFTYRESELTGMEGTVTQISFDRKAPRVISLLRSGTVKSAFILEEGRRHTSVYETPFLPFEVCVYSRSVTNTVLLPPLTEDGLPRGEIAFDYVVEIRGMDAQRTRLSIKVG